MQSGGGSRRIAWRASSNVVARSVRNPASSSAALMRTACSRSSVVTRMRSGMRGGCRVSGVRCPVRGLRSGDKIHSVVQEVLEYREAVGHTAGRAGKIDDQRLPARARHAAGQPRAREARRRARAERVGDPGCDPVHDRLRRFRRHVTRREPRPTRRENHVHLTRIRPAAELPGDPIRLIRDHTSHRDFVAALPGPRQNRVTRSVGPLSHGPQVAYRQYPDPHPCRLAALAVRYHLVLCGTNGNLTTSAPARFPRTSIVNWVPGLVRETGRYVMPIALFTLGVTVPLRTASTRVPSTYTSYPCRATTLGSVTLKPTSRRVVPSSLCRFNAGSPVKSAPFSSFTIQPRPASYGVTVSSMSLPYSG